MSTFYFNVTEEKINNMPSEDYETLERIQDGEEFKLYKVRPILCNFMTNEDGSPVPYDEALKITKKFALSEMKSFVEQFFGAVKKRAVPNGSGSPSQSPSEVTLVDSKFQDG